ncbi:coth protein-domain-containing protein [Syncephalastrum racemosum]|uniref:Coth protein-domain-containing protein n=1 Tax=Syncephalastrum racemosum TaxID=13706 RepID=A0A1X2HFU0_SYNRA|nr:coth protein-domain-containing protein [Syncephalastrum racemosum]
MKFRLEGTFLLFTPTHLLLFLLLAPALLAHADKSIEYRVITPAGKDNAVAVVVDDRTYALAVDQRDPLVHIGEAPVANHGYYYAKTKAGSIIERESQTRQPMTDANETPFEFYNRTKNAWDIRQLPRPYESLPSLNRIQTHLHRTGEIPTIHFVGNQSAIDVMHTNVFENIKVNVDMTYISLDAVHTFKDVTIKLSGRASLLSPKLSYRASLADKDELFGYSHIKLRAMSGDPSYIRENVAYAVIDAAGLPAIHTSYVRVYINEQPVGLFGLNEVFKKSWLRNEFANGDKKYDYGVLYKAAGAGQLRNAEEGINFKNVLFSDFSYLGDNETLYNMSGYGIDVKPATGEPGYGVLTELTKFIDKDSPLDGDADKVIAAWDEYIDMESLFRNLAIEFLLGFNDGYFVLANNYAIFQHHADSKRFIWLPNDLDTILGVILSNMSTTVTGDLATYPGATHWPLTRRILQSAPLKARLDYYIKDMSQRLIQPDTLFPYIDDTVAMITEDVAWDRTLPGTSKFDISQLGNMTELIDSLFKAFPPWINKDAFFQTDQEGHGPLPFTTAVDGPTGLKALSGVKEFISNKTRAVREHYQL